MTDESILLTELKSPKASVRYEATELLRVQAAISTTALSALKAALNDPDASVRESAASALHVHELVAGSREEIIVEEEIPAESIDDLTPPAGLNKVKEINELHFTFKLPLIKWLPGWAITMFFLVDYLYIFWPLNNVFSIFIACFLLIALYSGLAFLVNRATIRVTKNELRFQYAPLPFARTKQVPASGLVRLSVAQTKFFLLFYYRTTYRFQAVLGDGPIVDLAGSLPFPLEVLYYISVITKNWLGIKDKRVVSIIRTNASDSPSV